MSLKFTNLRLVNFPGANELKQPGWSHQPWGLTSMYAIYSFILIFIYYLFLFI